MVGIFVLEGMKLRLSKFSISMDQEGNLISDGPSLEVSYDACLAWAQIALRHRDEAIRCMETRRAVWAGEKSERKDHGSDGQKVDAEKAQALEDEFQSAMQAVVAAAICIDALYDHIVPFAPISESTRRAWREKKTARSVQVTETLRLAFRIKPKEMMLLKRNAGAIYKLRDASVHPSSVTHAPHKHPELDVATDWRFTTFRGDVADWIVHCALGLIWDLTRGSNHRSPSLTDFVKNFRIRVDKLLPNGRPAPLSDTVTFHIPPRVGSSPDDEDPESS